VFSLWQFWWCGCKWSYRKLRKQYGVVKTIGGAVGGFLAAFFGPKYALVTFWGGHMNIWVQLAIPAVLLLAFLAYHLLRAPYEVYVAQYKQAEAQRQMLKSEIRSLRAGENPKPLEVRIVETVEYHKGEITGGFWKPYCPQCHLPLAVSPYYESNVALCVNKDCGLHHVETTAEEIDEAITGLARQDK
jgi:hypothetical protein